MSGGAVGVGGLGTEVAILSAPLPLSYLSKAIYPIMR